MISCRSTNNILIRNPCQHPRLRFPVPCFSIYESTPKTIIVAKVGAAAPLPSRGGARGGVCISFTRRMLETPPLPLPLRGGERLRIVFGLFFSGEGFSECTPIFICKFRLAAAAAIIGGVRCHHWQRPLPIMSPPAANLKSMPLFPLRCLPLPVCRAPPLLNAPHRLRFASFKNCIGTVGTDPKNPSAWVKPIAGGHKVRPYGY